MLLRVEDALELQALRDVIGAVVGCPDMVMHVLDAFGQFENVLLEFGVRLAVALPCDLYPSKLYIRVAKVDDAI